jgi:hypothetical protein
MVFTVCLFSILIGGMDIAGDTMCGFVIKKDLKGNWIGTFLSQIGSKAMALSSHSISRLIASSNVCDGNPSPVKSLTALDIRFMPAYFCCEKPCEPLLDAC